MRHIIYWHFCYFSCQRNCSLGHSSNHDQNIHYFHQTPCLPETPFHHNHPPPMTSRTTTPPSATLIPASLVPATLVPAKLTPTSCLPPRGSLLNLSLPNLKQTLRRLKRSCSTREASGSKTGWSIHKEAGE